MAKYYTDAQRRATKKYHEANLYRLTISVPKAQRAAVIAYCNTHGGSVNKAVNELLRKAMKKTGEEWYGTDGPAR